MSFQIDNIESGDLEAYQLLKASGGYTASQIFSLGIVKAREELNVKIDIVEEIDQTLLDDLNREIALLRGENEALKLANSNLVSKASEINSDELIEAREKILKLEEVIDSLSKNQINSGESNEDQVILSQLADGSLSLKDFKANYGDKYNQVL